LSDGQIVAVLAAVNATEVSLGTLAMSRGVAPGVRNFGESMVTVHNTAQERQTRLAMSLDLKSEVSPLSTQLGEDAKSLMSELEAAGAADFDAAYLRSQVDGHMKVLMLISERLIPSVMANSLRDELMLVRMEVATHLEGARNASTSLEDTDAGTL
jgi:putative membrane protein